MTNQRLAIIILIVLAIIAIYYLARPHPAAIESPAQTAPVTTPAPPAAPEQAPPATGQ